MAEETSNGGADQEGRDEPVESININTTPLNVVSIESGEKVMEQSLAKRVTDLLGQGKPPKDAIEEASKGGFASRKEVEAALLELVNMYHLTGEQLKTILPPTWTFIMLDNIKKNPKLALDASNLLAKHPDVNIAQPDTKVVVNVGEFTKLLESKPEVVDFSDVIDDNVSKE